jgi:hypothetical protein
MVRYYHGHTRASPPPPKKTKKNGEGALLRNRVLLASGRATKVRAKPRPKLRQPPRCDATDAHLRAGRNRQHLPLSDRPTKVRTEPRPQLRQPPRCDATTTNLQHPAVLIARYHRDNAASFVYRRRGDLGGISRVGHKFPLPIPLGLLSCLRLPWWPFQPRVAPNRAFGLAHPSVWGGQSLCGVVEAVRPARQTQP